jgi:hypothetical protein
MWVDDAEILVECAAGGGASFVVGQPSELWLARVGPGAPRLLAGMPDSRRLAGVWRVGDRLVAGTFGPTEAEAGWWEITAGGVVPLSTGGDPHLRVVDVRGAELVVVRQPYSEPGVPATTSLEAIDPVRGTSRVLADGDPGWFTTMAVSPARDAATPQTDTGD